MKTPLFYIAWIAAGIARSSVVFAGEGAFSIREDLGGHPAVLIFANAGALEQYKASGHKQVLARLVLDLASFERETGETYFFQGASLEIMFEEPRSPGGFAPLTIRAYHPHPPDEQTYSKSFTVTGIQTDGELIREMTLEPGPGNSTLQEIFTVVNIDHDGRGNLLDRVILKSTRDASLGGKGEFLKFQEGKWIEYRDYSESAVPASFTSKTFILGKDGSKIWTKIKKSFNRRFNSQGLLAGETTQETTYTYSGLPAPDTYAIYNVVPDAKGEAAGYDVIFPKLDAVPFSKPSNLEVSLIRNAQGVVTSKLIRKYSLAGSAKHYLSGILQETDHDEAGRIARIREQTFDIKPGTTGLFESERDLTEAVYTWQTDFDLLGQAVSKRVLKTRFDHRVEGALRVTYQLFESLKEISILREAARGDLKKITVAYHDFDDAKTLGVMRTVEIEVLEKMITSDPSKIRLVIEAARDPGARHEQIIIQDCNYVINEAVNGDLFYHRTENHPDVAILELAPSGEILKTKALPSPGDPAKPGAPERG